MGRPNDKPGKTAPKVGSRKPKPEPQTPPDDEYVDAGDIATPEPDRDDEQRGL